MPGVNERLARLFPRPGLRRALLLLLRGSPFWKERPLRDILRQEFRAVGLQDMTLGALKKKHGCQVKIVAADLTNARPVVFESDSDSLLDAILHSCGVPFYFRLGGKEQVLVDGGIVENFPVEILTRDAALYGPVLGIAFTEPDRNPPESLGQFTTTMIGAYVLSVWAVPSLGRSAPAERAVPAR